MKHNLIKTDNYLLVVDDSEIKQSDWIYNEEREPSIVQCIGKGSLRGWAKIIAYLPLNGAPVLEGVPLLPPLPKEDDEIAKMADAASEKYKRNDKLDDLVCGASAFSFEEGYNKAKEKYKYTEEDVIKIVEKSRETGLTAEYLILSLQHHPKYPIAFECEMEVGDYGDKNGLRKFVKTITTSQGGTEWVGKYIYKQ